MWAAVNLMTVVLNLDSGPWRDARWYQQAREAAAKYTETVSPSNCPVWQMLFDRVVADRGEQMLMSSEGYEQDLFKSLVTNWFVMAEKIGMARWSGWTDAVDKYLPMWHGRLVVFIFMCISLGVMTTGQQRMRVQGADMSAQAFTDEPKSSTFGESDLLRKLRRACKNTAHLVVVCLSDHYLWELCNIVLFVFALVRRWHGLQSQRLRSSAACRQWYMEQALGDGFKSDAVLSRPPPV